MVAKTESINGCTWLVYPTKQMYVLLPRSTELLHDISRHIVGIPQHSLLNLCARRTSGLYLQVTFLVNFSFSTTLSL